MNIQCLISHHSSYSFWINFLWIEEVSFGDLFADIVEPFSCRSRGIFSWLLCIHPSHLLYQSENHCELEPYIPNHFARQFGYYQLYVGNLNYALAHEGRLIDGVRAWRHFVMGCTCASFCLPVKYPKLQTILAFYR